MPLSVGPSVTRLAVLRSGYVCFGLAFAALGASLIAPAGLALVLLLGLSGGVLLAFSDDEMPKWAGLALLVYFVISLVAFLAATPVTVRLDFFKGFINSEPSSLASAVSRYLALALPVMLGGTAIAAAWEREVPPRALLVAAVGGFILVGILDVALVPSGQGSAQAQGGLLKALFGVSALAGAVGAAWAAARPDEYG